MKSSESMTIGELAGRFGLAAHVLRHWEARGLLTPAARVNGRRRYTSEHVSRVAMIIGGKRGGLSLEQLRELFAAQGPGDRHTLLERHRAELRERMREIERSAAMIDHALECEAHDFTRCPNFQTLVRRLADGERLDDLPVGTGPAAGRGPHGP
ncbi:MerR family transcriptional regulator [Streptomyces sp. WMMC500]|uniref:MerR family transcriptional regulator n=1 Tax=Streptomyces sp. WMMC500 TaxID=3015154 RepID=UPI00248C3727|nr:MerR family transcriptional regulator [Streptomyces sp. WMMC500]WBB60562.1 MerR family transcriptional regulator [Streptomyces sp. WMMC500]